MPRLSSIILAISLLGAAQGLLLAAAIAWGRRRTGGQALPLLLAGFAATVGLIALQHSGWIHGLAWVELAEYTLWIVSGPLFYLFVRCAIEPERPLRRRFWLHFAPLGVWLAYLAIAPAAADGSPRLPPAAILMLYQMSYTALGLRAYLTRPSARPLPRSDRFWVRAWLASLAAVHAAQLLRFLLRHEAAFENVVPLVGAIAFWWLTFLGFSRSDLFGGRRPAAAYSSSTLTAETADRIRARLLVALDEQRLYLDPGLTLDSLAAELSVPRTHLSQVLNQSLGRSFLELVNERRAAEATRLLRRADLRHLTIEAIARRCGFASRSTFYEVFRRTTGVTPTEYRRAPDPPT